VHVSNNSSEAVIGTDRAIVGTLGTWVTIIRPSERPRGELGLCSDEGILLLDTKPRLLMKASVKDLLRVDSKICVRWFENLA